MTFEAIRKDIVTAVNLAVAGFTAYPLVVEYPNRETVDFNTQTRPFLTVKIKTLDGEQANLSDAPLHRITGQIHLAVAIQKGQGVTEAYKVLDYLYPKLQRKKLGTYVRTRMAVPADMLEHNNWCYYPALIPFWADIPT